MLDSRDSLDIMQLFNHLKDLNQELLLSNLLVSAISLECGLGSIPAQLSQPRYAENRPEGSFISLEKVPLIGKDFWRFISQ